MTDRNAVPILRGYFYQFDWTILSALQLANDDDKIDVECIEDVDIRTATEATAIQCKYYEGTEYDHSVIKPAVLHMLTHFKKANSGTTTKVSYAIRGCYASGQHKLPSNPDVAFLKTHLLTYKKDKVEHRHHDELGLTDTDLEAFLSVLVMNINAPKLDKQFEQVVAHLERIYGCTPFVAESFYYNNALALIRELSIAPTPANRTITKRTFLDRVNTSSVLFDEWVLQRKGKKAYLTSFRNKYFNSLNVSPFERFFLVEVTASSYVRSDLKTLLLMLSKKWSKTSERDSDPFCPYVFIHGLEDDELLTLKTEMWDEGFRFTDGHDFRGAAFSLQSIATQATHSNGIKLKLLNSIDNLSKALTPVTRTRKVYQFHVGKTYFDLNDAAIEHVKIKVQKFQDIAEIV